MHTIKAETAQKSPSQSKLKGDIFHMQYFKNTPRRGIGSVPCPSDIFPLCREDMYASEAASCGCADKTAASSKSACGCSEAKPSSCSCGTKCADIKTPTSEDFGCTGLAMAFVPEQEFEDLNDADAALCRGTLFQKLDMPLTGRKRRGCK